MDTLTSYSNAPVWIHTSHMAVLHYVHIHLIWQPSIMSTLTSYGNVPLRVHSTHMAMLLYGFNHFIWYPSVLGTLASQDNAPFWVHSPHMVALHWKYTHLIWWPSIVSTHTTNRECYLHSNVLPIFKVGITWKNMLFNVKLPNGCDFMGSYWLFAWPESFGFCVTIWTDRVFYIVSSLAEMRLIWYQNKNTKQEIINCLCGGSLQPLIYAIHVSATTMSSLYDHNHMLLQCRTNYHKAVSFVFTWLLLPKWHSRTKSTCYQSSMKMA